MLKYGLDFLYGLDDPERLTDVSAIQSQTAFFSNLSAKEKYPIGLARRSYLQYLCQVEIIGRWNNAKANILCGVVQIPFLLWALTVGLSKRFRSQTPVVLSNHKSSAVLLHNNSAHVPQSLDLEFQVLAAESGWELSSWDVGFFIRHVWLPHPLSFHYQLRMLSRIARYRPSMMLNPSAFIVSDEYSAASSLMTLWCQKNSALHINIMHGLRISSIRDAFSAHHRFYFWDESFKKVSEEMHQLADEYIVELPPYLKVMKMDGPRKEKPILKYYLQAQSRVEMEKLREILSPVLQNYDVVIRPHPRYTRVADLEECFKNFTIESTKVPVSISVQEADFVVSRYSTVLFEAWLADRLPVIDDVTSPGFFDYLKESNFIIFSKKHEVLSNLVGYESVEN